MAEGACLRLPGRPCPRTPIPTLRQCRLSWRRASRAAMRDHRRSVLAVGTYLGILECLVGIALGYGCGLLIMALRLLGGIGMNGCLAHRVEDVVGSAVGFEFL